MYFTEKILREWLHTELVALLVIAMEVDSTSLKHPFGNYTLSEIWNLQADTSNIFNGNVQERLHCLSKMSCLLSKNILFCCWGWRHHKYKYNYNWSLTTGLNEVNYDICAFLCFQKNFYKISLKDFLTFTHFTKIHNLTEITPLSSNIGERKT